MNKKNIIIYSCVAVLVIAIIAVVLIFALRKQKVKIEVYDYTFNLEKTVEISSRKTINSLNRMFEKAVTEENEDIQSHGIRKDIRVVFEDGRFFTIGYNSNEYCYLSDPNKNIEKIVTMPEGLIDIVTEEIK